MRTFIAIPLTAECISMLEKAQEKLRSFNSDVRWVSVSSIHLTLKFLGEIDPETLPEMTELLQKESGDEHEFGLELDGLGGFPNLRNPRVLWCGIDGDVERLMSLQKKVEAACERLGFLPENREFHPHLTLGRVQGKRNLQPLLDYIRIAAGLQCSFTATEFHIYRSVLSPRGARYSVLETVRLSSSAA
jgi:2'-5' RNA ligase